MNFSEYITLSDYYSIRLRKLGCAGETDGHTGMRVWVWAGRTHAKPGVVDMSVIPVLLPWGGEWRQENSRTNKINLKKSPLFLSSCCYHQPLWREDESVSLPGSFSFSVESLLEGFHFISYWYFCSSWLACSWHIFKLCQSISLPVLPCSYFPWGSLYGLCEEKHLKIEQGIGFLFLLRQRLK